VFSSTPFGDNQLAVLPDAAAISTEGIQKIAREFNFGETAFPLPKNDPNNRSLSEAKHLYERAGFVEVELFNNEPYSHHWFQKDLRHK